jgi:acetyl-CoA carboxylase biotin carboxyl carrier protein
MDIRKIKKLIELMHETDVTEIDVREGEQSVRISRQTATSMVPMSPLAMPTAKVAETNLPFEQPEKKSEPGPTGHVVRAPVVGTVYLSSTPGSKIFVEIGQHVNVGDVLCIIEAMKMFNQIEADKAGKIVTRLVENGQPVEFDQPLFIIE